MYLVSDNEWNDRGRGILTEDREDEEMFWLAYLEDNWVFNPT